MILVKEKLGNIHSASNHERDIDVLPVEWYETRKRILHKQTKHGKAVTIKFLHENPSLEEGDILYQDDHIIIVVEINACECIVINTRNMLTAAAVCYEIGNRHLPLFYEGNELLVPYDVPLYNLLQSLGYSIKTEERKLNNSFQTTVLSHLRIAVTGSLPDKINRLTTSS